MSEEEASESIRDIDDADHDGRVERLVELTVQLSDAEYVGYAGQAAQWLFEDVKATWLYGCFASTVVTAHAFCMLQLSNLIRMAPDDPTLPVDAPSLEQLASLAVEKKLIDINHQAELLTLNDRFRFYSSAFLHEQDFGFERHLLDADALGDEHALQIDARQALRTAIRSQHKSK